MISKILGVSIDVPELVDLAKRSTDALEEIAGSLKWLREEADQQNVMRRGL